MIIVNELELKDLLEQAPGMVLINVRPIEAAPEGHLPGSIHIPLNEFSAKVEVLFPDREIFIAVYGTDLTCETSTKAADILEKLNYKNIYNFINGLKGWIKSGYPIQL